MVCGLRKLKERVRKMGKGVGYTIREKLIEAGERGVVVADLFKDMKSKETSATYQSFSRYCWLLKKLGFIEPTGEVEVAWSATDWGENPKLHKRIYYKLTPKGREAPIYEWSNPGRTFYDSIYGIGSWKDYMRRHHPSTGRPRGRPRKSSYAQSLR